jgi:hypothetical protein
MAQQQGGRPNHNVRYGIRDDEAEDFLRQLADPNSEVRTRLQTESARDVLLDWNIDIVGIPETVELPPDEEIQRIIDACLGTPPQTDNVGYLIPFLMLGAMPFVVADHDGAP